MASKLESGADKVDVQGTRSRRFIRLIRATLFIYKSGSDEMPREIINLEGLMVKGHPTLPRSVVISHRDGFYPEIVLSFPDDPTFTNWLNFLKDFRW